MLSVGLADLPSGRPPGRVCPRIFIEVCVFARVRVVRVSVCTAPRIRYRSYERRTVQPYSLNTVKPSTALYGLLVLQYIHMPIECARM